MKLSKYTFLFDTENKEYYAYNSLSNALIEIDADSYLFLQKYQQYKELPEYVIDQDLWDTLCTNGIITENDEDDYLKYKASITNTRIQLFSNAFNVSTYHGLLFQMSLLF